LADNGFGPLNTAVLRVKLFSLNGCENGAGVSNSWVQHAHVSETIFQDAKLDQPPKRCVQLPKMLTPSVEALLFPGDSCLVSTLNPETLPAQTTSLWIIFYAQAACSVRLSCSWTSGESLRLLSALIFKSKPLKNSNDWEMLGHMVDAGIGVKVGSLCSDGWHAAVCQCSV
jgi:hypothetical protein